MDDTWIAWMKDAVVPLLQEQVKIVCFFKILRKMTTLNHDFLF